MSDPSTLARNKLRREGYRAVQYWGRNSDDGGGTLEKGWIVLERDEAMPQAGERAVSRTREDAWAKLEGFRDIQRSLSECDVPGNRGAMMNAGDLD